MAEKIKKISEKVDYKCPYFEIIKENFVLSDGNNVLYYTLRHTNFVKIIAKDEKYFYMIEIYRFSVRKKILEFPAGNIDGKEKPLDAAKRELKEETGITAKKFTFLGWHYSLIGLSDIKEFVFLAENLRFGKQSLDELEKGMVLKKIKISEIEKMIKLGKIKSEHDTNVYFMYLLKNKKIG